MTTRSIEVDQYISSQPKYIAEKLYELREIIHQTCPEAEECISYNMPAFKYHGYLMWFIAAKKWYSLFPRNGHFVDEHPDMLAEYSTSKGTIRFDYNKPIPIDLIKEIIKIRMQENVNKNK